MQIAEWMKEDGLTFRQVAARLGIDLRSAQRYRYGHRIPDRERMRKLIAASEGRVTPNDIYGLSGLIDELLQARADRLAGRKKKAAPHPELPFDGGLARERAA